MRIFIYLLLTFSWISCFDKSKSNTVNFNSTPFPVDNKDIGQDDGPIEWKTASWFKVESKDLCDDLNDIHLDMNKLHNYGEGVPYDTTFKTSRGKLNITFDFISDCCREWSGEVEVRNDTLFLGYGDKNEISRVCDCFCDYRMIYKISKKNRHWNHVQIINGRIK